MQGGSGSVRSFDDDETSAHMRFILSQTRDGCTVNLSDNQGRNGEEGADVVGFSGGEAVVTVDVAVG
jgi:hypothetical protein